ncbi:metallophosphoesterase family protein [Puniceicoccaceae bacterium K14]|nr:metallophosphoesterase family protein [Puniceicoccaceae bacterium K14]
MAKKLRILSDIHFGHKASIIKEIDQLEDLCRGTDKLIFNGDTIEQKYEDSPKHTYNPLPSFYDFSDKVSQWCSDIHFISGNHDPSISQNHFMETHDGDVFITHGDGIFENIAPWSKNVEVLNKACSKRIKPDDNYELQTELQLLKEASIEAHEKALDYDPTTLGKTIVFFAQLWPPHRPFKILQCWKNTPAKAVEFARRHGRSPKVIVIGHTHCPGIWKHDGIWVVNTGSFFPWPKRYAVEIEENSLTVRRISKKHNRFQLGTIAISISL